MTAALPGTLPGLLQPGCPVIWLDCDGDHDGTGDHTGEPCRGWVVPRFREWEPTKVACNVLLDGDEDVSSIPLSRLALDLSRPEGVDRALRWLAGRLGLNGRGPLPPTLTRFPHGCGWGWRLASYADGAIRADSAKLGYGDTDDPIEALRLACLAAMEVSGG